MLSTERLVLRPVTADDHAALLAHWTQPDVRRFLFDGAALSAAEVAETIEESIGDFAARGFGVWLIELRSAANPFEGRKKPLTEKQDAQRRRRKIISKRRYG